MLKPIICLIIYVVKHYDSSVFIQILTYGSIITYIEQFYIDFFSYLDKHRILYHKLSKLDKEEVDQMNVIVEKLMYELHNLTIEGGLISNFEQDQIDK